MAYSYDDLSWMLASAVVKVARDKLVTALGDAAAATIPDDEKLRRHMEDLKRGMEDAAKVVGDADRRSLSEQAVREWLLRLEDAAYGIWDMVDELQANKGKRPVAEVRRPWLPLATARKGNQGMSMASRMQSAKQNLDGLLQNTLVRRGDVDEGEVERSVADAHPTMPPFDDNEEDHCFVGRRLEKQILMRKIFSAASDESSGLVFLPIVGIGGLGKTALAEVVFFHTTAPAFPDYARAWVTVGMKFDLKKVGNSILSQLSSANGEHHQDSSDVESIMKRLDHLLHHGGNKHLLVVLDDLWLDDSCDFERLIRRMLGAGKEGRKVIVMVTTRSMKVAMTIGTENQYVLDLMLLDLNDSYALLEQKVGFAAPELHDLLRKITSYCPGVPLALHAIGSTVRSMSREEIMSVLRSDAWGWWARSIDIPEPLLVSYQCMPPNLRLCLAYCAIFPRGHNILMDDLIHHWTALQLIEPSHTLSTAQLATRYIGKLLDMAFLRRTTMQPWDHTCAVSFTLQNIVHDLAMEVSSKRTIVLDSTNSHQLSNSQENSYRQAWLTNSDISPANLSYILSVQLEVLLFYGCSDKQISDDSFSSAKYLRVLDLRDCQLQKLPDSILQLGQLRYLNLSGSTSLVSLPDSFGNLINLGHIDLSSCSGLSNLPDSFVNLTSVMHINLSGCVGLKSLTESFGNLTSVMHINLSGCVGLKSLTESFGSLTNVLHVNLSGCVGLKSLPKSFGSLEKLEHLDLSSCSCLQEIHSALRGLTNLQHLNLSHPCCYIAQHRSHLSGLKDVWDKLTNLRYLNLSMCLNPMFCYLPPPVDERNEEERNKDERNKYVGCISRLHRLEHLDLSHNIFLFDIPQTLGELSQLQTLNLSGCARLKRIDKWMGERNFPKKSLVVSNCLGLETYQFVVRTDEGTKTSNLSQLKEVSCKQLEISYLENVVSTEEAQSIQLAEKKKLQKLKLVWSDACDDVSSNDPDHQALLAELVPPKNLQYFELHRYRSQLLPTWLSSSIFSHLPNLVEVTMVDIPSCSNLPNFGVLPKLQRLILKSLAKVATIDAGCLSAGTEFHGLLHVTLDDMENLEEFIISSSSNDDLVMFKTLDELVINACPKLRFRGSPPKARMLVISGCDQLMSSRVKRRGDNAVEGPSTSTCTTSSPVTEVVIESCQVHLDELKWSLLKDLAPVHSLHIRNCSEKIISSEIMKKHLSSLKLLCFSHCDSMTYLPEHVVQDTSLQELVLHECHGIKSLPQSICQENKKHYPRLRIRQCSELKKWWEELEKNKRLALKHIIFEGESSSSEAETSAKLTSSD